MWKVALMCYGVAALVVAVTVFVLGLFYKERILGGNMKCGAFNSLLIGAFWPLFLFAVICGYCYDAISFLRKL